MGYATGDFEEKFWQRVDRSGGPDTCWPWLGAVVAKGYGVVSHNGTADVFGRGSMRAHRVAFFLANGELPGPPYEIAHTCDVRHCVNPAHLRAMTHADNVADRNEKGRQDHGPHAPKFTPPPKRGHRRGEGAARAKLTEDDVRAIRAMYVPGKRGFGYRSIAKLYGIQDFAVEMIVKRKSWAHVED